MASHDSDNHSEDSLLLELDELSQAFMKFREMNTASSSNAYDDDIIPNEFLGDDDGDVDFFISMQQQFGVGSSSGDQVKPLATVTPNVPDDYDSEDDYELLEAIRKRYPYFDNDIFFTRRNRGIADPTRSKNGEDDCGLDKPLSNDDVGKDAIEQEPCDIAEEENDASGSASAFPRVAEVMLGAIKKNRALQKFIRNKMVQIEARVEELNDVCRRLKTLQEFQIKCDKRLARALSQKLDPPAMLFAVPRQRASPEDKNASLICYGPLENSYVDTYKAVMERYPRHFHRERWTEEDRRKLKKGMVQQYQEKLLQSSVDTASAVESPDFTDGVDETMLSVRSHNITPEVLQRFASEVNWDQLASTYLPRRSGGECEARWIHHENPLNKKGYWTAKEDKKLLSLIEQHGVHNWSCVTEKLGTNRTPFQCLARYQRSLNAGILKREWTVDEDGKLHAAVEVFGESNWQAVASELEGWTGTQCSNRWRKVSREKFGKWSKAEDGRLKIAVALFGKSWCKIEEFVSGRTQAQCRERWVNTLDPSLKRGAWTEEETEKLIAAFAEHQYCWTKVAECVPSRTDNQCHRKWRLLFPELAKQLKADRKLQKFALVSNFADREVERPALGPNDFVSLAIEGPSNDNNDPKAFERSSRNLKRKKQKRIVASPNNVDEIKKRDKHSDTKRKKQPRKKTWEIPIKIRSRRARCVKSKVIDSSEESTNWEDLPLSVLFRKVFD